MEDVTGPAPEPADPGYQRLLARVRAGLGARVAAFYRVDNGRIRRRHCDGDPAALPATEEAALWQLASTGEAGMLPATDGWCAGMPVSRPGLWGWIVAAGAEAPAVSPTLELPRLAGRLAPAIDGHGGERVFRQAFEASEDATFILEGEHFVECNAAALRLLGFADESQSPLPLRPWDLAPERQPDGRLSRDRARELIEQAHERHFHRVEWECRTPSGETFPVEVTASTMAYRGGQALYCVCHDIRDRRRREGEIERLAHYDPLTQLPNRRLLRAHARIAIDEARRNGYQSGVLYLDLDRFKDINDTQGHEVGDALLHAVARRLEAALRPGDMLARLGGDEFAILMPEVTPGVLNHIAERVLTSFRDPFLPGSHGLRITASLGAVICPRDGVTLNELLKHADIAMYQAKREGCAFRSFEPEHGEAVRQRVRLERTLQQALRGGDELSLVYQPRIRCSDGAITSVEALARWQPPRGQPINPAQFIPVAESSGLIHDLGRRVLRLACRQAAAWAAAGHALRVAVNISARELRRQDFDREFLAVLAEEGVAPEHMEVEITESSLMLNVVERIDTLARLRAAGVAVSVDDFGTGYSSLSYLKRLPVDTLKIDKSFVAELDSAGQDAGIVETILALSRCLGLATIAEGVETEAQETALVGMGCTGLQGYRYGRPCSAEKLSGRLSGVIALPR